jgi:predicted RNA-binding Zn-ribbon protein involved in translation (DUF1610 family)
MGLKMPESVDECIYFTRRKFEPQGSAIAWVYRKKCPKCLKSTMGKPLDPKTKRPKIRSENYECPSCGFSEDKTPHEESLMVEVMYVCPHCGAKGEAKTQYKRVSLDGVKAYVFNCEACKKKIGLTKKMKEKKGKKGSEEADDDDE